MLCIIFARHLNHLQNLTCADLNHVLQKKAKKKNPKNQNHQDIVYWASLVAQWLRICLPMQGTRVRALVWEDPTCRGATGPVSHNY